MLAAVISRPTSAHFVCKEDACFRSASACLACREVTRCVDKASGIPVALKRVKPSDQDVFGVSAPSTAAFSWVCPPGCDTCQFSACVCALLSTAVLSLGAISALSRCSQAYWQAPRVSCACGSLVLALGEP